MSAVEVESTQAAPARDAPAAATQGLLTIVGAALLCVVAFVAAGGQSLELTTAVEIGLILAGGLTVAAVVLLGGGRVRWSGTLTLTAFGALAALTALSIVWAVNPGDAWLEASRTFAYLAAFAGVLALANAAPRRWGALLGAITLATVAISGYAVLTKVFPGALNPDDTYSRLRDPLGYWNAAGLMAALGVPGCLWLGTRRAGHQALNAAAFPAIGLLMLTAVLAYSRGALLAMGVGVALWFVLVPVRLRGAALLLTGAAGAAIAAAWTFNQDALDKDRVPLVARTAAGHQLGLVVAAMIVGLTIAGLAVGFWAASRPPSAHLRRRIGIALIVGVALIPVGLAVGLSMGREGLTASIHSRWTQLTDPHAVQPQSDPSRLTAIGSARARYWNDALKMFKDNELLGVGAGGYATVRPRYRQDDLPVANAHGYVVQTLADLGLAGLAINLALAFVWLASAVRAIALARRREALSAERIGLVTLAATVVVFTVSSLVDWTWFVPANTVVAVIAAAWVAGAGRRPADGAAERSLRRRLRAGFAQRERLFAAAVIVAVAIAGAWTAWQPQRSATETDTALASLDAGQIATARQQAITAHNRDPMTLDPLFALASVETAAGRPVAARAALHQAVRLQPSNPESWLQLGQFELCDVKNPEAALVAIRPALYLDPRSSDAASVFVAAERRDTVTAC